MGPRALFILTIACVFCAGAMAHHSFADSGNSAQPPPSTMLPPSINTLDGSVGTSTEYARADHQHPTSVQRYATKTDATGQLVWTFKRPFADATYAVQATSGSASVLCTSSSKTPTAVTIFCRTILITGLLPAVNTPVDVYAGTATQ